MSRKKIKWHNAQYRLGDLISYESNPRLMSEQQDINLEKSIDKSGYVETIVINKNKKILAGNQRYRILLKKFGPDYIVDVRIPDRLLSEKEEKTYLLASNAIRGSWNYELLKAFDTDLILDVGFDDFELNNLWGNLQTEDDDWDEEEEIAKIKKPKSKVGEIYALGPHRLAIGDATDPDVLKKLFGDERASVIYSDPVYNLKISYRKGLGGKQDYGADVNDDRTPGEYRAFLKKSMENALAVSKPDTHVFYWNDQAQIGLVQGLFEELGLKNRRVCLWIKNGQNPTPGIAFAKAYEPCIYATRKKPYIAKGIENLNEILNKEIGTGNRLIEDIVDLFDIWLAKRLPGQEYSHATSKPPTLHEKAFRRCTKPGEIILDSFLGSGSSLIAAEQLNRRLFGVELEPLFADLTILRYEKLTNQKAKKIN